MGKLIPSKEFREKVLHSIKKEELKRARIYLIVSISTTGASLAGIVLSIQYLVQAFYQSNFGSYLSLLFSDTDVVHSYWQELSLSLVETLPLLQIIFLLLTFAVLLVSLRVFMNNLRGGFAFSFNR